MEFLSHIEWWHWLALGLVLIVAEMVVPSTLLLWPGLAAIIVGIIALASPALGWQIDLMIWAVLSVVFAFGWQIYRKNKKSGPVITINRRGEQIIGRHFTLTNDIINGSGQLHVDDTRWKATSAHDLPAGTKVKVIAVEGTSLRVEEYIS